MGAVEQDTNLSYYIFCLSHLLFVYHLIILLLFTDSVSLAVIVDNLNILKLNIDIM